MSILISGPLPAHNDTMRWQKHRKENNLDFSHSVFKVRITRVDTLASGISPWLGGEDGQ